MIGGLREGGTAAAASAKPRQLETAMYRFSTHSHMRAWNRRCDASLARE